MPPALFGARHFGALEALSGDRGAGALLADAPCRCRRARSWMWTGPKILSGRPRLL
jgi:CTP:molybdopterin cytidylyltransferase MocA